MSKALSFNLESMVDPRVDYENHSRYRLVDPRQLNFKLTQFNRPKANSNSALNEKNLIIFLIYGFYAFTIM